MTLSVLFRAFRAIRSRDCPNISPRVVLAVNPDNGPRAVRGYRSVWHPVFRTPCGRVADGAGGRASSADDFKGQAGAPEELSQAIDDADGTHELVEMVEAAGAVRRPSRLRV